MQGLLIGGMMESFKCLDMNPHSWRQPEQLALGTVTWTWFRIALPPTPVPHNCPLRAIHAQLGDCFGLLVWPMLSMSLWWRDWGWGAPLCLPPSNIATSKPDVVTLQLMEAWSQSQEVWSHAVETTPTVHTWHDLHELCKLLGWTNEPVKPAQGWMNLLSLHKHAQYSTIQYS